MIRILFFGQLADHIGTTSLQLTNWSGEVVSDVLPILEVQLSPSAINALRDVSVMISVNQVLADWNSVLKNHDELAFMPPVSGG